MSKQTAAATKRWWVVRVAQEFQVQAETADEALAFMQKASNRKIKGAVLMDGKGVCGPMEPKS